MAQITTLTFDFLKDLKENNHKEWFQENKDRYEASREEMIAFAEDVLNKVREFDIIDTPSGKKSLYRIYRDVRFSKDKTPYKSYWSGSFSRAGAERRGGMYFGIEPNNTMIGGGFWGPNKEDLLHIRKQLEADASPLEEVLHSAEFKEYFGIMEGEQLKTSPKGFDKMHPNVALLRYKQYLVMKKFNDKEVLSPHFSNVLAEGFRKMLPFLNCFTEYLTTDMNGESIV